MVRCGAVLKVTGMDAACDVASVRSLMAAALRGVRGDGDSCQSCVRRPNGVNGDVTAAALCGAVQYGGTMLVRWE